VNLDVDTSQMEAQAADFAREGLRIGPRVLAITAVAGRNTRDLARSFAPTGPHLPHYAQTISYEAGVDGATIWAEVGPELGGQGSLGHILENGTATNAPQAHLGPAFDRELPNWLDHLEREAGRD